MWPWAGFLVSPRMNFVGVRVGHSFSAIVMVATVIDLEVD